MVPFFIFLFLFHTSIHSSLAVRPARISEYEALLSINAAINNSWNTTHDDFCTWVGVTCDGLRHRHRHVTELNMAGKNLTGNVSSVICGLSHIWRLDLSRNNLSGTMPLCKSLIYVDLSINHLSGEIPPQITGMSRLIYLNLSRNLLVGGIPPSLSTMNSLVSVDFSYNNLSGFVPENSQYLFLKPTWLAGNPNLCGGPYLGACIPSRLSLKYNLLRSFLFVGMVLCLLFTLYFGSKLGDRIIHEYMWSFMSFHHELELHVTRDDVLQCVKEGNRIGTCAYKGVTSKGELFAVKQIRYTDRVIFNRRIRTLGQIRSRFIVKVLASCSKKDRHLLVLEYMPDGSLASALQGGDFLNWSCRYAIALDVAQGLSYLYNNCSPPIGHGNVKSSNIFLFNRYANACISHEYAHMLKVDEMTEMNDVYSFGIVLMELVCGRVAEFGDDIVHQVIELTGGKHVEVLKIMDPGLESAPLDEVMHVFRVALSCVEVVDRPTMSSVVERLVDTRCPSRLDLSMSFS